MPVGLFRPAVRTQIPLRYKSADGLFYNPVGAGFGAGVLAVADTSNQRIQLFQPDGTFLRAFGSYGLQPGQFIGPIKVGVDAAGNFVVGDSFQLQMFDPATRVRWSNRGFLFDLAVAPDGTSYVSGSNSSPFGPFIQIVNPDGSLGAAWGFSTGLGGPFDTAPNVAFGQDGNLYTFDAVQQLLQVWTPQGVLLRSWTAGVAGIISCLGVDAANQVYVVRSFEPDGNPVIELYDSVGNFLQTIGVVGWGAGQVANPQGIALDNQSRLYVVDNSEMRIVQYSAQHRFERQWGDFASTGVVGLPGGSLQELVSWP